jgi:ATP-dependent helicase YprA (DUF1998 family)
MSVFDLHADVVRDYQRYVQSFLSIADDRIRQFVETKLRQENVFWPDALLQLNPSYQLAQSVDDLAAAGTLTTATSNIFRTSAGAPIQLYQHQCDAISRASKKQSYVVTSGTGSGKSLTYFIPIFDAILRGNAQDRKVWAIVIYPMNALVNSQWESLTALGQAYQARTGQPMPVRFDKYTGQEDEDTKNRIQQERPHILLTNFMMLEMMLLRPQQSAFVDKTTSGLQFLVLDELHMYRGRQGADVAMLVRRLKERCGNFNLLHIGTSATMVAARSVTGVERRTAVGDFAGKLFGTYIPESNVIEETLVPVSTYGNPVSADDLHKSIEAPLPQNAAELLGAPLTAWVEATVGIEKDAEGVLRRKVPQSLSHLASVLSETAQVPVDVAEQKLQQLFLEGSRIKQAAGSTAFAFKLHQFISQGRAVYGTIEDRASRFLSLDGQYYAPSSPDGPKRLLYPLLFCRVCGQEYYRVKYDDSQNLMTPWTETAFEDNNQDGRRGYLMLPPSEPFDWSNDDLPPEWLEANGKVRQNYRNRVPRSLHVQPDGAVLQQSNQHSVRAFFQDSPFLICQSCGEYYTLRDRDFRKLTGLSNEGRSSATTTLVISALDHAEKAGIAGSARKLLSFTDNRQDASLQAGHFNDFVLVSLLRAAIYDALEKHGELRHYDIADKTVASLGLKLSDIAQNPQLDPESALAGTTRKAFRDLIEYRIYEDLRRAWRVVHPNLEQCGLLRVEYEGLEACAKRDDIWAGLPEIAALTPKERVDLLTPLLDFARKKLAIHANSLREVYQQQLRQRVNQVINERWCFDDSEERLRSADCLILPGQATGPLVRGGETLTGWRQRIRFWTALALLRCVMSSPAAATAAIDKRLSTRQPEAAQDDSEYSPYIQDDSEYSPYIFESADDDTVDVQPGHVVEEGEAQLADPERRRLRNFARQAEAIKGTDADTKIVECTRLVAGMLREGYHPIVWCRYIATSDYVRDELERRLSTTYPNIRVLSITGALAEDERRALIDDIDPVKHGRRVLVATDCLSEGINLQRLFNAVIHYDLPWNPNQREERLAGLDRLQVARTGPVRHLATAVVLAPGADTESQLADLADELDPNIRKKSELAAEDLVVAALKEEGFPEDRIERVGHLKLGFDVRAHRIADDATGEALVKRVEVKGRMRGQPVRLTTNEWYKAQQLAETYGLYVVWDPLGKNPELVRIQNPAVRLDHAKREIVAARFFEIPAKAVALAAGGGS